MSAGTPADEGATGVFESLVSRPAGIAVLVGLVLLGLMYGTGARRMQETGADKRSKGFEGVVEAIFTGLFVWFGMLLGWIGRGLYVALLAPVGRFLTGREVWGPRTSNATLFRSGYSEEEIEAVTVPDSHRLAAAVMAAEAAYGPEPVDWTGVQGWFQEQRDRLSDALWGRRGAVPGWATVAAQWGRSAGTLALAAGRGAYAVLTGLGNGVARWHRWPRAARAVARWGALAVPVAALAQNPVTATYAALTAGAVTLAAVLAAATGPAALGWWAPRPITDVERYAEGVWNGLVPILRLDTVGDETRAPELQQNWLSIPNDLANPGAEIVISLPPAFMASAPEVAALEHLIATRIPGEWVSQFQLFGKVHWVKFTHKPKPKAKLQLPKYVEWIPSMDPFRVMVGQTHQGPYYVDMGSATPHWGVSGGTGDGKTTALLIPAVHARQHGALVDCITLKTNAFEDIEGESGIRVHKNGADAVAALAEFYVSMKAAEKLRGTPEGDAIRPRYLLIDEFGSFVLAAKLWWKYGIGGKGIPPFEAWFHMTLMQGRSSNHRIIVGAHTFSREMFGSTEVRDLVGTKALMGPYSDSKWLVTFGAAEKVDYDSNIKGRGAIGITGQKEIHEIQYAYITPEARKHLRNCLPAPEWFDRGEPAPWITPEATAEADREAAVGDFLPGGKHMVFGDDDNDTAGDGTPHTGTSGVSQAPGMTSPMTPGVSLTKDGQEGGQEAAGLPLGGSAGTGRLKVYSLMDACKLGIIPFAYGTARNKKSKAQKSGQYFPEGVVSAGVTYYTAEELRDWYGVNEEGAQAA